MQPFNVVVVRCLMLSWICICLCFAASCKRNHASLHDRIVAAKTSQYCRMPDQCSNPNIFAWEKGYTVTAFINGKLQTSQVANTSLGQYLESLPMQAWPRGSIVTISLSDDVFDANAVRSNLLGAQQLCRAMGLEVKMIPAG